MKAEPIRHALFQDGTFPRRDRKPSIWFSRTRGRWVLLTNEFYAHTDTLVEALNLAHYGNTRGKLRTGTQLIE